MDMARTDLEIGKTYKFNIIEVKVSKIGKIFTL